MQEDLKHFHAERKGPLGSFQLIEPDVALALFVAGLVIGYLIR